MVSESCDRDKELWVWVTLKVLEQANDLWNTAC